jgi:septal ring factor EnvC (AmiA/AmiB activator)
MLGHQVGAGIRAGLRRLAAAEENHDQLREQLREAEAKANGHLQDKQQALDERDHWQQRALAAEQRQQERDEELAAWKAGEHQRQLNQRIRALERQLAHQSRRAEAAEARLAEPPAPAPCPATRHSEAPACAAQAAPEAFPDLQGACILCVGGRQQARDHYRRLVEQANGRFLHHDGGIEQSSDHLEQMLARADQVVCPVDCVAHQAVRCVKDHCRRAGTPCRFLESASVTALSRALPRLQIARLARAASVD